MSTIHFTLVTAITNNRKELIQLSFKMGTDESDQELVNVFHYTEEPPHEGFNIDNFDDHILDENIEKFIQFAAETRQLDSAGNYNEAVANLAKEVRQAIEEGGSVNQEEVEKIEATEYHEPVLDINSEAKESEEMKEPETVPQEEMPETVERPDSSDEPVAEDLSETTVESGE